MPESQADNVAIETYCFLNNRLYGRIRTSAQLEVSSYNYLEKQKMTDFLNMALF